MSNIMRNMVFSGVFNTSMVCPRMMVSDVILQSHHKSIPIGIRNKIVQYADGLELKDPKEVRPSNPEAGPVEGFEVFENGFKCIFEGCSGYYSAKEDTMKEHCRTAHNCHEKKWVHQAVQTFFPGMILFYYINF
jgi:hypothetical protein